MRKLREPEHVPSAAKTKTRILSESSRMFALSGYTTVSVRDIAKAAGIKSSSIYSHYENKQDILDSIMQLCEDEVNAFYSMLDTLSAEATSFRQLVENIFIESKEVTNPFVFYALYCAGTCQFEYESCQRVYYDTFFRKGWHVMRRQLDIAVERDLTPPFDTDRVGSIMTNCFMNMVSVTVGCLNGFYQEFDRLEWYGKTVDLILFLAGAAPAPTSSQ